MNPTAKCFGSPKNERGNKNKVSLADIVLDTAGTVAPGAGAPGAGAGDAALAPLSWRPWQALGTAGYF